MTSGPDISGPDRSQTMGSVATPARPSADRSARPRARSRPGRPVRPPHMKRRRSPEDVGAGYIRPVQAPDDGGCGYPGPSGTHLVAYPPKERWDDWVELDSKAWPRRVERRSMLVPTTCFNCESACGLLAYVDPETLEVRKFEGNPEHPGSRGRNCAKGPATLNQIRDPDRILHPLRRAGARGGGSWEPVSWDEALDDIAGRIRRAIVDGRPNEVMYHVGTARRGRVHGAGAGRLGRRRSQLAHEHLLELRPGRLPLLDGARPPEPRPRERRRDPAGLGPPRVGALLQPPCSAHHRRQGPGRQADRARHAALEHGDARGLVGLAVARIGGRDPARDRGPPHPRAAPTTASSCGAGGTGRST